jgi:hypothetical protein
MSPFSAGLPKLRICGLSASCTRQCWARGQGDSRCELPQCNGRVWHKPCRLSHPRRFGIFRIPPSSRLFVLGRLFLLVFGISVHRYAIRLGSWLLLEAPAHGSTPTGSETGPRLTCTDPGTARTARDTPSPARAKRHSAVDYPLLALSQTGCRRGRNCPCPTSTVISSRLPARLAIRPTPVKLTNNCSTAGNISITPCITLLQASRKLTSCTLVMSNRISACRWAMMVSHTAGSEKSRELE